MNDCEAVVLDQQQSADQADRDDVGGPTTIPSLEDAGTTPGSEDAPPTPLIRLREQRLHEFKSAALECADPLSATLDAIAGDSMELHTALTEMMRGVMASAVEPAEIRTIVDMYYKSGKQLRDFVNLSRRIRQDSQAKEAAAVALAVSTASEKTLI